jgi:hypothetical protein
LPSWKGNCVKFKQRVDRLSKSINEIKAAKGGFRIVFQEPHESPGDALKRAGLEHRDDLTTVFIIKWCSGIAKCPGDRADEAQMDAEEKVKFQRHTNKAGDFRTLKDAAQFYGDSVPKNLGPNQPDPGSYSVDQESEYQADLKAYRESGGQRLADGLIASPSDKHEIKRRELMAEDQEWAEKERIAKEEGKTDNLDRARYFRKDIAKQMRALPEPPAIKHQRDLANKQRDDSLGMAFDKETAFDSFWNSGRMKDDFEILAAQKLTDSESDSIYLPQEISRFGDLKEFTPGNVLIFDSLPENVRSQVRQNIKNANADEPKEMNRIAWSTLHRLGYADSGKPGPAAAPKPKKAAKKKSSGKNPKKMTQREYESWAESRGMRRF